MPLNPHTFPLVPLAALAPELTTRSGMGAWEPYALDAPTDRLLPFVLARRTSRFNAPWLSCAWLAHADTGQKLIVLVPTGAQAPPATVPSLGLVVQKLVDPLNQAEYFTYEAALIPGLANVIPCGIPLRLVVDNAYQSPRFYAVDTAANLRASHLPLEWYHDGPLQGVPYGRGLRQTFYLNNGSLQFLDHRPVQESTKDPNGGPDRLDSVELFAQRQFVIDPVPLYLSDALEAAQGVETLLADGQPWRMISAKSAPVGTDGGRWSITGTLEDLTPLLSRGCVTPPLTSIPYDPVAFLPRGWRCGDASDVAPDYQPMGVFSCELDANQLRTGYVLEDYEDLNPNSPSYHQVQSRRSAQPDPVRCPLHAADARVGFNKTVLDNGVQFDVTRTDAIGDLMLSFEAEAEVSINGAVSVQRYSQTYTIPDKSLALNNATLSFGGAILVHFRSLCLVQMTPAVYTVSAPCSY